MTNQIIINITSGNSSVTSDDIDRAEAAALTVLGGANLEDAYAEYRRQLDEHGGLGEMTGAAAVWEKAESAANVALTDGWHNPDGGACEISV